MNSTPVPEPPVDQPTINHGRKSLSILTFWLTITGIVLALAAMFYLTTTNKIQKSPMDSLVGSSASAMTLVSPTNNTQPTTIPPMISAPSTTPMVPPAARYQTQPLLSPAPAPVNVIVNNNNSPGAAVNISIAGGNSQQQVSAIGGDWKNQPPTRKVDIGMNPSDTLQPGDNVEYSIPRGTTVTPMPMDDSIPQNAIEWVPIQPWGYQALGDNWNCGSIRMRMSPQWRGGAIRMDFNRRPEGQPLERGNRGGQHGPGGFQGGRR